MQTYLKTESVQLVQSGGNYFDILEQIIDQCKNILHLQTYIFDTDNTGLRIINALKRAAARHVKVFILVDAFGSLSFSKETISDILSCGIHFRFFSPLFSYESGYFGRRLHYKVIVADKKTALTGGINIADKYNINSSEKPWLDYALLIRGTSCEYLHIFCEQMYEKKKNDTLYRWEKEAIHINDPSAKIKIRFRINDWLNRKNEIQKSYLESLIKAQKTVTIVSSYFLPNYSLRKQLAEASSRGVAIKILLTGKSDVASTKWAENYLYDFYFRNKIQVYEWNNSILHAKVMMVDSHWVTVGSYNLNFLSHYISIELNTDIDDHDFAGNLTNQVEQILLSSACIEISKNRPKKNWMYRIKMWLFYTFYYLVMNLTVSKKRQNKLTST